MTKESGGAAWHFEGEFGTSRIIVRMAERSGQVGIKVRLDSEGADTKVFLLTPEQAGFLGDVLPTLLVTLCRWQERGLESFDPFADLIKPATAEAGSEEASPVAGAPVSSEHEASSPVDNATDTGSNGDSESTSTPARLGKSWSEDEEARLVEGHASGKSVTQLATLLQRSPRAIQKRLEKLDLVDGET